MLSYSLLAYYQQVPVLSRI